MLSYPTDLSDSQWQVIKEFLNCKRKRTHELRCIVNAILYVVKTGCQWRMLPHDFAPWQSVYYYFQVWQHSGVIETIQQALVKKIRVQHGKNQQPSVGIIDAQSVKSTLVSNRQTTGFDGGKKIKGIKRHIIVDTLGLLLCVVVHSAGIADRKGGALLTQKLKEAWSGVVKLFADGGYSLVGKAKQTIQQLGGYVVEIVQKKEVVQQKKCERFQVLPKRWVVERTFAWIDTNRRNAKSYERLCSTAEAITQLSAIRMMLNRAFPDKNKAHPGKIPKMGLNI
jgi:putative transposase